MISALLNDSYISKGFVPKNICFLSYNLFLLTGKVLEDRLGGKELTCKKLIETYRLGTGRGQRGARRV